MCSIHADQELSLDDSGDSPSLEHREAITKQPQCRKCSKPALIAVRPKEWFCRQCFLLQCRQKVRATFGKARLIHKGDKALLAYSGGVASSTLLGLTKEGLSDAEQRKLRFDPTVCYVDEASVHGWSDEERAHTLERVGRVLSASGFPFCVLPLELVFCADDIVEEYFMKAVVTAAAAGDSEVATQRHDSAGAMFPALESETLHLKDCVAACKSLTAKEDLVMTLRTRLLSAVASSGRFDWVLTAESCTRLVIRTLSDIAKGKGAALPYSTAFADRREKHTAFLRPLREFSSKEIGFYCHFQQVDVIQPPEIATKVADNASLDRLTEGFVLGLQANFPSTVSTVFRTSGKLSVAGGAAASDERCVLCKSPMDVPFGGDGDQSEMFTKARTAAGHLLGGVLANASSKLAPASSTSAQTACSSGEGQNGDSASACGGSCSCSGDSPVSSDMYTAAMLKPYTCYGCRLVLHDMKQDEPSLFPSRVTREVQLASNRSQMREEIKDFLLEDD